MDRREWLRIACPACGQYEEVPVEVEDKAALLGGLHVAFKQVEVPHKCAIQQARITGGVSG